MLHILFNDRPWFDAKRTGYGAGLPIAWQGWALLGSYMAAMTGASLMLRENPWLAIPLMVLATAVFLLIARRHTRGGWRWRSDGK